MNAGLLQQPKLTVYGHVGFDVDTRAGTVTRTVGGAAYYAASAAIAAGCEVELVTVLGADFPERAPGTVDVSGCRRSTLPSAVFTQTYNERNEVVSFEGRLNACTEISPELISLVPSPPAAILIGTAPPPQQAAALASLERRAFKGLIAIDTSLAYIRDFEELLQQYARTVGLIFLNAQEYEALLAPTPPTARLMVKRGPDGASMLDEGRWTHMPAPLAAQVRTTTGAGDVLAGSFLAAWLARRSSDAALVFAVKRATQYVEVGPDEFFLLSNRLDYAPPAPTEAGA